MEQQTGITYFNTAASGLLSETSLQLAYEFNQSLLTDASTRAESWRNYESGRIRELLATFMGAPVSNVAFVPNFSLGLTAVVHSLKGSEKVLLFRQDFPSVLDAFKVNHFNISWLDTADGFTISAEEIKTRLLSEKIDILCISHVQWASGFKLDIDELAAFCRQHGILFIIDATQSMGALPMNMRDLGADVVISSNYKWMNAGFGSGVMYVADSFLERYTPKVAGFHSYVPEDGNMVYYPSARSFEPGHPNIAGLIMLEAAMKEKLAIGLDKIEEHNQRLTQQLLDGIAGLPVTLIGDASTANRSSIVIVKDENGLGEHLKKHNIVVTHRAGNLRISMHFYNTAGQVAYLVDCLREF